MPAAKKSSQDVKGSSKTSVAETAFEKSDASEKIETDDKSDSGSLKSDMDEKHDTEKENRQTDDDKPGDGQEGKLGNEDRKQSDEGIAEENWNTDDGETEDLRRKGFADSQTDEKSEDGMPSGQSAEEVEPEDAVGRDAKRMYRPDTRNKDIDKCVDQASEMDTALKSLMQNIKEVLDDYKQSLAARPLKDFVYDLNVFRGDFTSMCDAYKSCESMSVSLNRLLKELRHTTDEVNNIINKKFRDEDLSTWIDSEEHEEEERQRLQEEQNAEEKAIIAKAAEARAVVAKAAVGVSESRQFAAQAEAEAAEAEVAAKKARDSAEEALRAAEVARKAAAEKRKAEEEARKRAEEKAKEKEEEERKKKEEEELLLEAEAKRKGTSLADERKKAADEKALAEAARKDPKNWPRYIYSVDPGDFDPGVGCVVRAIEGSLKQDDVECERVCQMSGILTLLENEELVSNIIELSPVDKERKFSFEEPFSIAIPHCAPRGIPGREAVVKTMQANGKWTEIPTSDFIFEDIKEIRFVEGRTKKFGKFAVILRLKRDTLTFTKKGNRVASSVDPRVTLACKPAVFKVNSNFNLEIQPVELAAVTDIRYRYHAECEDLLASSPIVHFSIPNRKLPKPLTVTLPLPPNTSRPKRPTTAVARENPTLDDRPVTARPLSAFSAPKKEDEEEEIHLLQRPNRGPFVKVTGVTLVQSKNKDIVSFEIAHPYERFFLLRTKIGLTNLQVEKIANLLETSLSKRPIQMYLRQKNDDISDVVISCTNSNRVERALRKLAEEGYEEGPAASKEIVVTEGQVFEVKFRGNIKSVTENDTMKFVFNTHIKSSQHIRVQEVDRFAQKSIPCYRGFAQIVMKGLVPKPLSPGEKKSQSQQKTSDMVEGDILLTELLTSIPKPDPEPPKPLNTAPVKLRGEGVVNEEMLHHVADELGEEWKKLAQYLNLKRMRIQAIMRQNVNQDNNQTRYDMLVTWAKRVPRYMDKSEILCHALTACGRGDIAEELRERDEDFRREKKQPSKPAESRPSEPSEPESESRPPQTHESESDPQPPHPSESQSQKPSSDECLRTAFAKITDHETVLKEWHYLAKQLDLSDMDREEIENSHSTERERVSHCLEKWRSDKGSQATISALTRALRICNYEELAREIETTS